jgi:transposase
MTIQDVAHHMGVSWDIIKDIQRRDLERRFARPKLKHLRQIAIDEISAAKGHRYLSVVLDLKSGAVVFVGDGKGGDALRPFWKRLRSSRAKIEAVAMDMSPAYREAVSKHLSGAVIVFDHFHVIKLFNEKLSNLRRQLYRRASSEPDKQILKGTRWLLLKNPENLDPQRNEQQCLKEALKLNRPLATAYYLKEELRQFWSHYDRESAETFLTDWIARARITGIKVLKMFANTLSSHREGLLAYYDHRISSGQMEGTTRSKR